MVLKQSAGLVHTLKKITILKGNFSRGREDSYFIGTELNEHLVSLG